MMKNNLNFTVEMKKMVGVWKGKVLKGYIENDNEEYVTIVRFLVENKAFNLDNEYMRYEYPDKSCSELTCFSCVEIDRNEFLQTAVVGGKCKENIVEEKIVDIYIVTDTEKGGLFDSGLPYELVFETALIIQTKSRCYAFWRHISFNTIEIAVCEDMEIALKTIRSAEEIQEEAQVENPYTVTVERRIEKLNIS